MEHNFILENGVVSYYLSGVMKDTEWIKTEALTIYVLFHWWCKHCFNLKIYSYETQVLDISFILHEVICILKL